MRREDELLAQAKQLHADERRRLAQRILKDLGDENPARTSAEALDEFLKLEGTGHSAFTDVAGDKYKHLAEAYSNK